jgi:purine catabolism regulator
MYDLSDTKIGISIEDLLSLQELKGTKIIAGESNRSNIIQRLTVMDSPYESSSWYSRGDLVLSSGYLLMDKKATQIRVIRALADKDISALGIKFGRFILNPNSIIINEANVLDLPVLHIPPYLRWADIIASVMGEITNKYSGLIGKYEQIRNTFLELILRGDTISLIAKTASKMTSYKQVFIFDDNLNVLAQFPETESKQRLEAKTYIEKTFADLIPSQNNIAPFNTTKELLLDKGLPYLTCVPPLVWNPSSKYAIQPFGTHLKEYGFILLKTCKQISLGWDERVVLEHSAFACTIECLRKKETISSEKRSRINFVDSLIAGFFKNKENAEIRAKYIGWSLPLKCCVLLFRVNNYNQYLINKDKINIQLIKDTIFNIIQKTIASYSGQALISEKNDDVLVILPLEETNKHRDLSSKENIIAKHCKEEAEKQLKNLKISIGIGTYHSPMQIKRSYDEAKQALFIGKALRGSSLVTHYNDIGLFQIINSSFDDFRLKNFVFTTLNDLILSDRDKNTQYLETLRAYLSCGMNKQKAAKLLYIHVNTLKYRIKKIERTLGCSLNDPERRLNIETALHLYQLID